MLFLLDPSDRHNLSTALVMAEAQPRSAQWHHLEQAHLAREGWCRYCGGIEHLQVHHKKPFHLFPALELDERNLITLCMAPGKLCHFVHGHLGNWSKYNPHIERESVWDAPANATMLAALAPRMPWAWLDVERSDNDLVYTARATCFGGSSDPQDNGITAFGFDTRAHPEAAIVSLPCDGRKFSTKSGSFHKALDGSPVPRLPQLTVIKVERLGEGDHVLGEAQYFPFYELGPAEYTHNGIDLTEAAAKRFDAQASAVNFSMRARVTIPGGVQFLNQKS